MRQEGVRAKETRQRTAQGRQGPLVSKAPLGFERAQISTPQRPPRMRGKGADEEAASSGPLEPLAPTGIR